MLKLNEFIRDIPDFPKRGILFRDITPLLLDVEAFQEAVRQLIKPFSKREIDSVCGIEARGFIFGAATALELGCGFIPIRKPGKLPAQTASQTYQLEYGADTIEVHSDCLSAGKKVLMVDDLLATGGTMTAACKLIEGLGGNIVGISFLVELAALRGIEKLTDYDVHSVIVYD